MSSRGIYRVIMALLALATIGMAAFLYISWCGMREETEQIRMSRRLLDDQIELLDNEKEFKTEYYYRLLHDEKFAGRVIREKLGFAQADEVVFRFDDSQPANLDDNFSRRKEIGAAAPIKTAAPETAAKKNSVLERLMFWKKNAQQQASSVEVPKADAPIKPELRVDLTGASEPDAGGTIKPQSDEPAVDIDVRSSAQSAGKLKDSDGGRVEKISIASSSAKTRERDGDGEKVIRFRSQ